MCVWGGWRVIFLDIRFGFVLIFRDRVFWIVFYKEEAVVVEFVKVFLVLIFRIWDARVNFVVFLVVWFLVNCFFGVDFWGEVVYGSFDCFYGYR